MAGSSGVGTGGSRGPTWEDCQRLWDTLVTEYVTDLKLSIEFQEAKEPSIRPRITCWSPGLDPETGGVRDHTWGVVTISNGSEAITYSQLYRLLMDSYRVIEGHLGGQTELPLS